MTKQYIWLYDRKDETFVVSRKEVGLPNMEFWLNSLGIHMYYPNEPNESNITFKKSFLEHERIHKKGN